MSEASECNRCALIRMKEEAKEMKMVVTVLTDSPWPSGGNSIYVHPKEVNITKLSQDRVTKKGKYIYGKRHPYLCCMLLAIGAECTCWNRFNDYKGGEATKNNG